MSWDDWIGEMFFVVVPCEDSVGIIIIQISFEFSNLHFNKGVLIFFGVTL